MIEFRKRKLQKIGVSFLVSLPLEWVNYQKLQKGSEVNIRLSEDGNSLIITKREEHD